MSTREGFIVTFRLGEGAIRWYEKNTNDALEDKAFTNELLVNRLKVR